MAYREEQSVEKQAALGSVPASRGKNSLLGKLLVFQGLAYHRCRGPDPFLQHFQLWGACLRNAVRASPRPGEEPALWGLPPRTTLPSF